MLRIVGWQELFENNRTRDMKTMAWVPLPNRHDGDGYTELLDHKDGPAHYGAWVAIVQVASKCEPRGTLLRDTRKPHDARSISRMTRIPQEIIEAAIPRLVSIGWLELVDVDSQEVTSIPQEGAEIPQEGAPRVRARKGTEGNGKEQNGTEEKRDLAPPEGGCPPELKDWIDWWNRLRAEDLVPCGADDDPPSQAVVKAWNRAQREAALRAAILDRDKIETAIRQSPLCREGWFRLEKLFAGKNRDGEYILRKLVDGAYVDKSNRKVVRAPVLMKEVPE